MSISVNNPNGQLNLNINANNDLTAIGSKEHVLVKESKADENLDFNKKDLDLALKKLNNFLKHESSHAEYSVHETFSNTIMIKIIDDETKQVIMEIPPKKILDMVAKMCEMLGIGIDKKA